MNDRFKNPHPFDMSNYFTGNVCVLGGRDFDREEKEVSAKELAENKDKKFELDWSFLKSVTRARRY